MTETRPSYPDGKTVEPTIPRRVWSALEWREILYSSRENAKVGPIIFQDAAAQFGSRTPCRFQYQGERAGAFDQGTGNLDLC